MTIPKSLQAQLDESNKMIDEGKITEGDEQADLEQVDHFIGYLGDSGENKNPETEQSQTATDGGEGDDEPTPDTSNGQAGDDTADEPTKVTGNSDDSENVWKSRYETAEAGRRTLDTKYRTLKGKYDAEVPKLLDQVAELKESFEKLKNAKAGNTDDSAADTSGDKEQVEAIKSRLREDYPDDLVDSIESMVSLLVNQNRSNTTPVEGQDEITALKKDVDEIKTMTQQDKDLQELGLLVPDWQQIDTEGTKLYPKWVEFLLEEDDFSGRDRNHHLMEAWNNHDMPRVAKIFNKFKQQLKTTKTEAADKANNPPPAEPSTAGGGSPSTAENPNDRIWTLTEVRQIEALARSGRFRGKEKQLERLRDEYTQATAEGRLDESK